MINPSEDVVCPFFLRRYSIVTPYQLHIKSIVSMEYLWTNDGTVMEHHWKRNKGCLEKLFGLFFGEMGIFVYFCPHYKINEKIHLHINRTHGHLLPDLLQGSGG